MSNVAACGMSLSIKNIKGRHHGLLHTLRSQRRPGQLLYNYPELMRSPSWREEMMAECVQDEAQHQDTVPCMTIYAVPSIPFLPSPPSFTPSVPLPPSLAPSLPPYLPTFSLPSL